MVNQNNSKLIIELSQPWYYVMYSNLQGSKDEKFLFFRSITHENTRYRRGKIIQMNCDVKFHFFISVFDSKRHPSTKYIAILSYSEYSSTTSYTKDSSSNQRTYQSN